MDPELKGDMRVLQVKSVPTEERMLNETHSSRYTTVGVILSALVASAPFCSAVQTAAERLPNFDWRLESRPAVPVLTGERAAALRTLRAKIPGVRVDLHRITESPAWIHSRYGFLTGPDDEEEILPAVAGAVPPQPADPHRRIKEFLNSNAALFGHGAEVLVEARITRQHITPHNGMRTVVWQQELDGIPVFEAVLCGHIRRNGELVSLCSQFIPGPAAAADAGVPNRLEVQTAPPIPGRQALAEAAVHIGEALSAEEIKPLDAIPEGPRLKQRFTASMLQGEARTELVWLPIDRQTMRLCWRVVLAGKSRGELFQVLVDAETAELEIRHCWTFSFNDTSYRVYNSDSPSPFSPGHSAPNSNQPMNINTPQPEYVSQANLPESSVRSSVASPLGWVIADTTIGNNVDAHTDVNGTDNPDWGDLLELPNPPRPVGTEVGGVLEFHFDTDLTQAPNQNSPARNQDAAVVNAFYWGNWMHDRLYELGFTEAAGNKYDPHPNVPRSPLNPLTTPGEEHNMGEVWCVTLWEARANLIAKLGYATGQELFLRLVVDGMNLCPPNPDFLQARDALVLADLVLTGGAHWNELWAAFAKRGMGWSAAVAKGEYPDIGADVTESFDMPETWNAAWTYATGGPVYSSPALGADGTVYVGSNDGELHAIGPDGTPKWAYPGLTGNYSFVSSPAAGADGTIYAGCYDSNLYAIFPNGTLKWARLLNAAVYSSPAIGRDGTIYVGTLGNRFYAVAPDNTVRWDFPTDDSIFSSPAIGADGTVYFASWDGKVYALDGTSGNSKLGAWPYQTGALITSSPALGSDGTICIGSEDGKVHAIFPPPSGQQKWVKPLGSRTVSPPAVGPDGSVYIGSDDGSLYAFAANGDLRWTAPAGSCLRRAPAIGADGTVYVGTANGSLYVFSAADGEFQWWTGFAAAIYSSPVIGPEGKIYFGAVNGNIYALPTQSGPARSAWPMFRQNSRHLANAAEIRLEYLRRLPNGVFQCEVIGQPSLSSVAVEASVDLVNWTSAGTVQLTDGAASYLDGDAPNYTQRFYRASSGSHRSFRPVGFLALEIPPGLSMIANQLNTTNHFVRSLFQGVPDGTTITKFNESTEQTETATFVSEAQGWTGPNFSLSPREGAVVEIISANAFTVTLVGEVLQGYLVNPVRAGLSRRSSMVPQSGGITLELGFVPVAGDSAFLWDNAFEYYHQFQHMGELGWYRFWPEPVAPVEPEPGVGEAFWLELGSARDWIRSFSVWPP
jgi:outer membrane protein assembly factor BamB